MDIFAACAVFAFARECHFVIDAEVIRIPRADYKVRAYVFKAARKGVLVVDFAIERYAQIVAVQGAFIGCVFPGERAGAVAVNAGLALDIYGNFAFMDLVRGFRVGESYVAVFSPCDHVVNACVDCGGRVFVHGVASVIVEFCVEYVENDERTVSIVIVSGGFVFRSVVFRAVIVKLARPYYRALDGNYGYSTRYEGYRVVG